MPDVAIAIQQELFSARKTKRQKYCDLFVGRRSWGALLKYESILLLCQNLPGALGLALRAKLYPRLLGACGRNVSFGAGVVLRHPHKIRLGDNVVIDDHCVLDAKGADNRGIQIGSGVFIGRNTILSCKNGDIVLEDNVNLGFNCEIFSGSRVVLGPSVLVAAYTYFIGGGHEYEQAGTAVLDQARTSLGITVGAGCWFGAGVKVMDGVTIGEQSIIGTGAVVTHPIPAHAVAVGLPARVVRDRRAPQAAPPEAAP